VGLRRIDGRGAPAGAEGAAVEGEIVEMSSAPVVDGAGR
jgi:hypothetical protein